MTDITNEQLVQSISKIIASGDLASLTVNKVLRELQEEYKTDLTSRKEFVKENVMKIIQGNGTQDKEETPPKQEKEEEEHHSPEKNGNNKSEDNEPADGAEEELTELDAAALGITEQEYELQKQIMEGIKTGIIPSTRKTRSTGTAKPRHSNGKPKSKKRKSKKSDEELSDDAEEEAPKKKAKTAKKGISTRVMSLSPALSEFLGKNMIPRTEVVKLLHAYIKEHQLQDQKNKRKIIFDEKLQQVFKTKSTDFFKINRLLTKHVKPADEVM